MRLSGWNHLACFAHLLNLVVTDAIKDDDELADLIEKVKAIVTFFHRSSKACDNLVVNQNRLNFPNHKLIQQVETRWNSVYYMLDRYLEQEEAIKTTLCLLDKNNLIIPSEKSALIKEAVTVLKPFEAVTTEMSAEKKHHCF